MKVVTVPQLMDNFAYLVIDEATREAGVVDCSEADVVLASCAAEGAKLVAILPTHHHQDHVEGNLELLQSLPSLQVYGVDERVPGLNRRVTDGDRIGVGTGRARILFIPAHTTGHIAYHFEEDGALFTGDTLFAAGCGRLFEGDPATMLHSLSRLRALPDDTRVYFGHEYTEKNLRFALSLEPGNAEMRRKYDWVRACYAKGESTTPTTIGSEKDTNPFFRWDRDELRDALRERFPDLPMDDVSVFARTRELRNVFS